MIPLILDLFNDIDLSLEIDSSGLESSLEARRSQTSTAFEAPGEGLAGVLSQILSLESLHEV